MILAKLLLNMFALIFVKRELGSVDGVKHLIIDLIFAVGALIGYQSLLNLHYFHNATASWLTTNNPLAELIIPQYILFVLYVLFVTHLNYWIHRIFHMSTSLWHLHKFHHSQTIFTGFSQFRSHPLEEFTAVYIGAIITALIFPFTSNFAIFYGYFAFLMGIANHTNVTVGSKLLNKIFITPEVHRIHHSTTPEHFDKNFGFVFAVWDHVYGTYYDPCDADEYEIGLAEYKTLDAVETAKRSIFFNVLK